MANYIIFLAISSFCLLVQLSSAQVHHTNPYFQDHPCRTHQDCFNFPNTDCSNGRNCACKKEFVEVETECLPYGNVDMECKADQQCTSKLGILSRCSPDEKKCECYDTRYNGKNATVVYGGTCYYRKNLGDRCDTDNECQASFTPPENIQCKPVSDNRRVCTCLEGKTCTAVSAAATSGLSFVMTLTLLGFMTLGRTVIS